MLSLSLRTGAIFLPWALEYNARTSTHTDVRHQLLNIHRATILGQMQKKSSSPAQHIPKPHPTIKKGQTALTQRLWCVLLCNWNLVKSLFVASAGGPNIVEKTAIQSCPIYTKCYTAAHFKAQYVPSAQPLGSGSGRLSWTSPITSASCNKQVIRSLQLAVQNIHIATSTGSAQHWPQWIYVWPLGQCDNVHLAFAWDDTSVAMKSRWKYAKRCRSESFWHLRWSSLEMLRNTLSFWWYWN